MREALNGRPASDRSRREYQRVIDAYRRVYFGSPASSRADPSVVATAELMVEMGRQFDDNKILRGAVEQYRFLRQEYPGSKYRFDALFTIAEIYKDDLDDPEEARATFENFLHRYPRNHLADDARAALKELDTDADEMERTSRKSARPAEAAPQDDAPDAVVARRNRLPRVTGVRHWSTPDYTRVAIDVEQEVKYASQRISRPDRIFFDLRDTRLASTLVGKTFDVDDGFLKKIRVAEFQPGRTRIVLEVDELASYDAFLLPDPYRLIIDVHGKQNRAVQLAKAHAASDVAGNAAIAPDDEDGSEPPGQSPGQSSGQRPGQSSKRGLGGSEDAKSAGLKTQSPVAQSHVSFEKSQPSDADDAEDNTETARTTPPTKTNGVGVVKTQVTVAGSDRKIPKTIVEADDEAPTTVATLEPDKLRPEVTPAQRPALAPANKLKASETDNLAPSDAAASNARPSRRKKGHAGTETPDAADLEVREAQPTAAGSRSLTRALGLKIGKIVIDAGHGGHDTGTIGPDGLLEKDLVLDVAKRLGRLLETRLGAEVVYTRQDDTFIPLETRTAIANRERADLFISVHANSSRDSDARGVETYYLNFTSSPEALEVAARENAVSEKSIHELQDLVKKIALKEKIDESREFAADVQDSLYGGLSLRNAGIRNRGVKKAPFIVLIGANMPSILAEISFVSNPTDERKLETPEHRQRIAESLYRGVSRYVGGLSGVKVASKIEKTEGP